MPDSNQFPILIPSQFKYFEFIKHQGVQDTGIQGYRDTGIQEQRDLGIQGYRALKQLRIQEYYMMLTCKAYFCAHERLLMRAF